MNWKPYLGEKKGKGQEKERAITQQWFFFFGGGGVGVRGVSPPFIPVRSS